MNSARDPTSRLRATLNPLRTSSLGVLHGPGNTPTLSALSIPSHSTFSASQTPLSAIQPYNPQEWAPSPALPPDRTRHHYQELPPQQSPPPPPPPYSPPRSQGRPRSGVYESPAANISAARAPPPPPSQWQPSEQPQTINQAVNQTFAPPPGSTRGGSRERRFGLPSFGRRREPAEPQPTISPQHIPQPPVRSPQPLPPQTPHTPHAATFVHQHPVLQPLQIPDSSMVPPASRRAVSTGAIGTPTSARSRSSSQVRWDQGMPLPPPPPGPPPSGSRSQSMNRTSSGSDPLVSPPTRRPPPTGVAALGPVPPTPAGWFDHDAVQTPRGVPPGPGPAADVPPPAAEGEENSPHRSSLEDSSNASTITGREMHETGAAASLSPNASPSLARTGAVRGEKTIRERRNESRTRGSVRGSVDEAGSSSRQMSNIVIPSSASAGTAMQRSTANRSTPRSGGLGSGRLGEATPRTSDTVTGESVAGTATPPFSSPPTRPRLQPILTGSESLIPKALPTPPSHSRSASTGGPSVSREAVVRQSAEQFCEATVERFYEFAHREEAAASDADRVKLFAAFMVCESRIRRERYAAAMGAMSSEIFDLTRDLFRPMAHRRESVTSQGSAGPSAGTSAVAYTPQSSEMGGGGGSNRGSMNSLLFRDGPPSAPIVSAGLSSTASEKTPASAGSASSGSLLMSPAGPPAGWQQSNYMPSLSPILSMSVSEHRDDESSRGRTASRWWESSSYSDGPGGRLERSKRESKYMGVPKEAREALQWTDHPEPPSGSSMALAGGSATAGSSQGLDMYQKYQYSNEYPPEKVPEAQHTQPAAVAAAAHKNGEPSSTSAAPSTPSPAQLDISRLVTLPPPFPRHHPAVNNHHPELSEMRSAVRSLSNMEDVQSAQQQFARDSQAAREEAARAAESEKQAMRARLQAEIGSGRLSYAGAAAVEAEAQDQAKAQQKAVDKTEFERFQTTVVMPVNTLLTERIGRATQLFDELRGRLFVETHEADPNGPQEEGDEQPELLEKLTLLKWIFEARESLHRAVYDLLSDRNGRYREMVLTPYRQSGNAEKLAGAEAFFADDAATRALAFATDSLRRTQEFRDVIEENVVRGVEVQLSAFWDIAPPLAELLDHIPMDLRGFAVRVPAAEIDETPSYRAHPLQYLFSLLLHAEKSTHQFIESQTNLLCLMHEVKEAAVAAKERVREQEQTQTPDRRDTAAEEERRRLTEDLQDKVRMVQDQWRAGLGDSIVLVKERVGGWLLETGGWDESLEDGGIGSV